MVTKNDIKLMIEDSEKNIINIISGSSKIQNDKIDQLISQVALLNGRIDKLESSTINLESKIILMEDQLKSLKSENDELKESLQFTQEEMIEKKFRCLENEFSAEFDRFYENYNYIKDQHRRLEDRTRRCNLRIDGIDENQNETWNDTEKKVKDLFEKTLGLQNCIEIERAHRMSIRETNNTNSEGSNNNDRPRTIIIKLLRYKDKQMILDNAKKLKDTGIFIYEDFSNATNEIRKNLKVEMKRERKKVIIALLTMTNS